jgi:hypothetical protein
MQLLYILAFVFLFVHGEYTDLNCSFTFDLTKGGNVSMLCDAVMMALYGREGRLLLLGPEMKFAVILSMQI